MFFLSFWILKFVFPTVICLSGLTKTCLMMLLYWTLVYSFCSNFNARIQPERVRDQSCRVMRSWKGKTVDGCGLSCKDFLSCGSFKVRLRILVEFFPEKHFGGVVTIAAILSHLLSVKIYKQAIVVITGEC